jgi:hypothetical protein
VSGGVTSFAGFLTGDQPPQPAPKPKPKPKR